MANPIVSVSPDNVLEGDGGAALDFSAATWNNGSWSGLIQAKTTADAGSVTLTLTQGEVSEQRSIVIDTNVVETMEASKDEVMVGETFTVSFEVRNPYVLEEGASNRLPRIPEDEYRFVFLYNDEEVVTSETVVVERVIAEGDSELAADTFVYNVACGLSGEVTIQVWRGERMVNECTVTVGYPATAANLAEAINERNLVMGRSSSYTGESSLSDLRQGALACEVGYLKTYDAIEGSFTSYTEYNTDIPALPEEMTDENIAKWLEDTYSLVCGCTDVRKVYTDFDADNVAKSGQGTQADCSLSEPTSRDIFNAAWHAAEERYDEAVVTHGDVPRCTTYTYCSGGWQYQVTLTTNKSRYKLKSAPSMDCTIELYMNAFNAYYGDHYDTPLGGVTVYDGCGFLDDSGDSPWERYTRVGSFVQHSSNNDWSQYFGTENLADPHFEASGTYEGTRGFYAGDYFFVAHYHFKHQ